MNSQLPRNFLTAKSFLKPIYPAARNAYKKAHKVKNHLLNFLDKPILILIYHRVTDLQRDTELLAVSPENFRAQIKYLSQHYKIVRLEEDWSKLREKAIVITFDDGYADNALEALPILEETGVPATFFVSTGHIGTKQQFWWDQLEAILLEDRKYPSYFKLDDASYGGTWSTGTFQERKLLYRALNISMKRVSSHHRENWLGQLMKWADVLKNEDDYHRSMTQSELVKLSSNPLATIGAHTVTHTSLSVLDEQEQWDEIISSKRELERIIKKEVTSLAYPYGGKDSFNQTTVRLCREAGITKAATGVRGQVHRWSNPLLLRRQVVRDWDLNTFADNVKRFWA